MVDSGILHLKEMLESKKKTFPTYLFHISKGAILTSPKCHGTGCFFAPPRKSVHKLIHILGAPKKHSQIPEVALVDFSPDGRLC